MAFCAKCGSQLSEGTTFCGSCGAPVGAVGATGAAPAPVAAAKTGIDDNIAGLLVYVPFAGWIISIVFLLIEPYNRNKFIRFHAFQRIFFNVAYIAIWIVLMILDTVISAVTGGWGGLIMVPVHFLLWLALLGLEAFLMYKAYNNERFKLPIIGALAEKQAG